MRLNPADRELEHISRRSIRPIAGGLGLMFLSGVRAIVLMLPPGPATVISARAATVVGVFMAGLWIVPRHTTVVLIVWCRWRGPVESCFRGSIPPSPTG